MKNNTRAYRKIMKKIILLLLVMIPAFSNLALAASSDDMILLDNSISRTEFGKKILWVEDKEKKITIHDIHTVSDWRKNNADSINFGFTESSYWFQFTADNPGRADGTWYLEISYPMLDLVELYIPLKNGGYKTINVRRYNAVRRARFYRQKLHIRPEPGAGSIHLLPPNRNDQLFELHPDHHVAAGLRRQDELRAAGRLDILRVPDHHDYL